MGEKGDKLREAAALADQEEELQERQKELTESLKGEWLDNQPLSSHFEIEKKFAKEYNVGLSEARKAMSNSLKKYEIEGRDIPLMIKELRTYRRTLKGEPKIAVTKSIDNLINAYSNHLDENINKIYWVRKYKPALKDLTLSEENIIKLSLIHDEQTRREIIDTLCKYWEARLDRNGMAYGEEYARLTKEMASTKREVNSRIKKYVVNIGPKELIKRHIVKLVSEEQGISARQVHERLPTNLFRKTSPSMISKMARSANVTVIDGALYKMSDEIKKDIYAYTAAFIDSDGYITMDKNHNPRVGLVATGDRGKAFMLEMHKSLGCGRPKITTGHQANQQIKLLLSQ